MEGRRLSINHKLNEGSICDRQGAKSGTVK